MAILAKRRSLRLTPEEDIVDAEADEDEDGTAPDLPADLWFRRPAGQRPVY